MHFNDFVLSSWNSQSSSACHRIHVNIINQHRQWYTIPYWGMRHEKKRLLIDGSMNRHFIRVFHLFDDRRFRWYIFKYMASIDNSRQTTTDEKKSHRIECCEVSNDSQAHAVNIFESVPRRHVCMQYCWPYTPIRLLLTVTLNCVVSGSQFTGNTDVTRRILISYKNYKHIYSDDDEDDVDIWYYKWWYKLASHPSIHPYMQTWIFSARPCTRTHTGKSIMHFYREYCYAYRCVSACVYSIHRTCVLWVLSEMERIILLHIPYNICHGEEKSEIKYTKLHLSLLDRPLIVSYTELYEGCRTIEYRREKAQWSADFVCGTRIWNFPLWLCLYNNRIAVAVQCLR